MITGRSDCRYFAVKLPLNQGSSRGSSPMKSCPFDRSCDNRENISSMTKFTIFFCALNLILGSGLGAEINAKRVPNIVFCLADDWSWPHAEVYGDRTIKTPAFDRVAREGMLFTHAFC